MIKCCQNCRFFDAENEACLNRALEVESSLDNQLYDLLDSGELHKIVSRLNIFGDEVVENKIAEDITAFFQENLDGDAYVHITDPQTFRCNRYE